MGRKRKCSTDDENCCFDGGKPPVQRNAANERERDRMRVLSKAFSKLKTTLPWVPPDTKLSKLDTLRLATCYIAHLRQVLAEDEACLATDHDVIPERQMPPPQPQHCQLSTPSNSNTTTTSGSNQAVHPLNLTWPYGFSARVSSDVTSSIPCAAGNDMSSHH